LIPPFALQPLLEKLQDRNVMVHTPQQGYEGLEIIENLSRYEFTVTYDEEEKLVLQMDGVKDTIFYAPYRFVFSHGVFYFPTKEQLNMITQIRRIGMNNHQLPITGDHADRFFSEALPVLKRSAEVEISETI